MGKNIFFRKFNLVLILLITFSCNKNEVEDESLIIEPQTETKRQDHLVYVVYLKKTGLPQ